MKTVFKKQWLISLHLTLMLMVSTHVLASNEVELARHDFPYPSQYVEVLGSKIHYVDTGGKGSVVLMIHGQPTWSYIWRNIIPHLEKQHRVIALDLIGFGKSDKPNIQYLATDHAKYLKGFIEALKLNNITLVVHDWGSILGFDYAANNPNKIKAIAFMEAAVNAPPAQSPYVSPKPLINSKRGFVISDFFQILQKIKTPGVGEKMILEENFFIEQLAIPSLASVLTEDELNAYREPFVQGKNRRPMLQFPRDVPIDGLSPGYTIEMMAKYNNYLRTQKDLPKLLLHLSEGFLIDRWKVQWLRNNLADIEVHDMGAGGHFMQEFNPDGIGMAISMWMTKNRL